MRFLLSLYTNDYQPVIPLNYQYPLSAAIYKIIQRADASFSTFLHNTGYGQGKSFKLFTFSDIHTPFKINGDRMQMLNNKAQLTVCFHVTQAAENFIKGLFMQQQLGIADKKSKALFTVQQVEAVNTGLEGLHNKIKTITLQSLSPVVTGRKNKRAYKISFAANCSRGYAQLALGAGLSLYNSIGMGCIGVI